MQKTQCITISTAVALMLVTSFVTSAARADHHKPQAPVPDGYSLVYSNAFDKPDALKGFQCTDAKAWRIVKDDKKGHALNLFGKSKYKYKVRSPLNIALIDGLVFGDFVMELEMLQTGKAYGHRDMCLFYGFQDRSHFYYTHMATVADPHAHNIFLVNDKPRKAIAKQTTKGVDWGTDKWQKIRVQRDTKAGTIKIFWNDFKKPIMVAEDKHFLEGYIGFGSFDDTGKVANVKVWAPMVTKKQTDGIFNK